VVGSFYSVRDVRCTDGKSIRAEVLLNGEHEIYRGHFPGMPVVPGVCLIDIVKEIVSQTLKKELMLVHADSIKFVSVTDPNVNPVLQFEGDLSEGTEHSFEAKAVLSDGGKVLMKFRGRFTEKGLAVSPNGTA
jgi:3-hydroxyacyl-[acyl-carrier-protein] dehydratase